MIRRNQPLRVRDKGNNGTAGKRYFSKKPIECSICTEEALIIFEPPLCPQHWEIALICHRVRGVGLKVTTENIVRVKRETAHLVRWKVADGDVPALLASYQAVLL